jgi:dipeptidyl-peptidase-3
MKFKIGLTSLAVAAVMFSCKQEQAEVEQVFKEELVEMKSEGFDYMVEQFADLKLLRYQIPGFETLSLKEQKLVYYLTQAGLAGRDIMWDQNYRHNLTIRKSIENLYTTY